MIFGLTATSFNLSKSINTFTTQSSTVGKGGQTRVIQFPQKIGTRWSTPKASFLVPAVWENGTLTLAEGAFGLQQVETAGHLQGGMRPGASSLHRLPRHAGPFADVRAQQASLTIADFF